MNRFLSFSLTICLLVGAPDTQAAPPSGSPVVLHPSHSPVFFGITAAELPPALRAQLGAQLPANCGLGVTAVSRFGPAEDAGIRPADIILEVAGEPVSGKPALISLLQRHAPGDVLPVIVLRTGSRYELTLRLGQRERQADAAPEPKKIISDAAFDAIMRQQQLVAYQLSLPRPDMARVYAALGNIRTLASGGSTQGSAHIFLNDEEGTLEIRGNENTLLLLAGKANAYSFDAPVSTNPLPESIRRRLARLAR